MPTQVNLFSPAPERVRLHTIRHEAAGAIGWGQRMSLEQDVAAVREAVDALERACTPLARHFGDTVDARRLKLDVGRVRDDLNLLFARTPVPVHRGDFASVSYGDGYDDGIGGIPGIRP